MSAADADVVVVGAGLAGLRCASDLVAAGRHVVVLESGDAVGGRVRTDRVDGYLVDRGFQLLNPAYPAVRSGVDVDALGLQRFEAGVAGRTASGLVRLGLPWRAPRLLAGSAGFLARRPGEVRALLRWARPLLHPPGTDLADHLGALAERGALAPTVGQSLADAGLEGTLRRVMERFLAGVLLEDDGESPPELALLLVSSFLRGTPGLPTTGMQALPRQLARAVPDLRLQTRVDQVSRGPGGWVVHTPGGRWRAPVVVVAAGPVATSRLTALPEPQLRGVVTAWFAADEAPDTGLLHLDVRPVPAGPVVNTAVVSAAAPSYAPPGKHLVQASALPARFGDLPRTSALRRHAGELLGCPTDRWRTLAVQHVHEALPAQPRPFATRRPVRLDVGLFVCGDHLDTPSIQGALVSGRRTARHVLAAGDRGGRRAVSLAG